LTNDAAPNNSLPTVVSLNFFLGSGMILVKLV
jgi:hypothetical protein